MKDNTLFMGLDVHADFITVAVAENERNGEVRSLGNIANKPEAIRKLAGKEGRNRKLHVCYEAGPCGYGLYWEMTRMGIKCDVIAPTLIPKKPGDRVKTNRRDAEKLARCLRAGELTPVWVPDKAHEALRDLVRARESAVRDRSRARQRLGKFLLRLGRHRPTGINAWTQKHLAWLKTQEFEHRTQQAVFIDYVHEVEHQSARLERIEQAIDAAIEQSPGHIREVVAALKALRGVGKVVAVGVVAEVGQFSRFRHPSQLMGYSGVVPSEYSTGAPGKAYRGGITKTGNSHLRQLLTEAAWAYRYRPCVSGELRRRQQGLSEEIKEIAWKAQHRLHDRYWSLTFRGKPKQVAIIAVVRELLGFMWSIGVHTEQQQMVSNLIKDVA